MRSRSRQLLNHKEFPVLYVDDEPDNLRVFELSLEREFRILTATSAEEGLSLLNENPVAVVLSDQRMPGVTGVEFLARVRELDPRTVRVLVTAYGDVETLGQAINDGSIYRYIPKPWEPEDMRLTLRRAIESYALEQERIALLDELKIIDQLSRSLHRETNLDRLIELLLQSVRSELGFDGAAILFFDPGGDRLCWRASADSFDPVSEQLSTIQLDENGAPHLLTQIRNAETHVLELEAGDILEPAVLEWVTEVSAEEIVLVPLVGKREVIGVLAVDNRCGGRRFEPSDLTLLERLATQAVIAIENARLVEELQSSREQVMRADRLGTLGTLAAGIAHEINNPLVSIHTFLSLAPDKRNETDESFWGDYHRLASGELERIRTLVSDMSRLGRGGNEAERGVVDLGEVGREVTTLMQREVASKKLNLELIVDPDTPRVLGLRSHLHQLLLNLLVNAIQATPEGGKVCVRIDPDPGQPSQRARLCVQDSGAGIPAENMERIFDPFFTTKDPDQGTGLGLMIAHEIIADHGGDIEVVSRDPVGSAFFVRLPSHCDPGDDSTATS